VKPVYKRFDLPVTGPYSKRNELFQEIGKVLEAEIEKLIGSSTIGDDFNFVKGSPEKTWEDLALSLPAGDEKATNTTIDVNLVKDWEFAGPIDALTPVVQFHFLAPMDNYFGELKQAQGSLHLSPDLSFNEVSGNFEVDMSTLTMGSPDLDAEVHKKYIKSKKYPSASFKLIKINHPTKQIEFGEVQQMIGEGELNFLEVLVPVTVKLQVEVVLDEEGELRMIITGSFETTMMDNFGIEGPDGPYPANDTIKFYFNIALRAKK